MVPRIHLGAVYLEEKNNELAVITCAGESYQIISLQTGRVG